MLGYFTMKNYVISLKTATDRRQHIENQFSHHQVEYQFFNALTPDLAATMADKLKLNVNEKFLAKTELACFMSHVALWQKMLDENISYMAIFEDDIYLGDDASFYLNSHDWIDPDWNIIKIEAFNERVLIGKPYVQLEKGNRSISKLKSCNLGTAGYILSIKGAKEYLEYIQSIELIPLDQLMFNQYVLNKKNNIYQMNPALCIQEMILYPEKSKTSLVSDLYNERQQRMKNNKKKGWSKIKLEIYRIYMQLFSIIAYKTIKFK